MSIGLASLYILLSFVGMELIAWLTHKYVMHGFMWYFHKDHHQKKEGWLEKNDLFFLMYASPGIILIISGIYAGFNVYFFIGLGISLYGFTYFLVHDLFIHQRIKLFRNSKFVFFIALRKAHKAHHKILNREQGTCFGLLVVPKKYYIEARNILSR